MRKKTYIDPVLLKKHLRYDPDSGQFSLRIATKRCAVGHVFGAKYPDSYVSVTVAGALYRANRAAWVYMTGKQPDVVDHINGIRHDNRWANLRDGSASDNARNQPMHRAGCKTRAEHRRKIKETTDKENA